jgi:ribosomal-protein-alanine N-acetyltransferase
LLAHVLASAARTGCTMANLEVRAGNQPAIALYERHGFRTVSVRARYYQDDGEDALVMLRGLS